MMKKTLISTLLALSCAIPAVAQTSTQVLDVNASATLKHIFDTKTIVMAVRDTAAPFSYNNGNDQYFGYSVQICEDVIRSLRVDLKLPTLKVVYLPITGAERVDIMKNRNADIECGSTTNTMERAKSVNFSNSFFYSQSYFVGKKGQKITKFEDLKGLKVALPSGTIQDKIVKEKNDSLKLGLQIINYKNAQEAFLAVFNNEADFMSSDDLLLLDFFNSTSGSKDKLQFYDTFAYAANTYGVMLPKDDPEFTKVFNKYLNEIFKSGKAASLYEKWLTKPIPPKNNNLNWPLPPELQKLFNAPNSEPML